MNLIIILLNLKIPYKMIKPVFNDMIEDIIAYETFEHMSDIQFFDKITIYLNIPISEICFNMEDTKIALQILTIKSLSGFNNPLSDYNFYINNKFDSTEVRTQEKCVYFQQNKKRRGQGKEGVTLKL